jgi:hypothetical protein
MRTGSLSRSVRFSCLGVLAKTLTSGPSVDWAVPLTASITFGSSSKDMIGVQRSGMGVAGDNR